MIDRRDFLSGAVAGLSAVSVPRTLHAAALGTASIEIVLSEPIATISPDLYGCLLENLGTVIYDGVWVGEDSTIPNIGGIRKDLIDRLREIKASVIRWPGGNFADYYDWKDGIGPKATRPRRTNMWSNYMPAGVSGPQRYDPNEFGTPEFMRLCRLSGGRPFLNVNTRSLPAQEFTRWVEYCNSPSGSTTAADLRKADGSAEPYNVRYWGIGNEAWAAGGDMTVEEYAALYKRFTANVPKLGLDLSFIACGGPPPTLDMEWVRRFLHICKQALIPVPIAAMSLHYYSTNIRERKPPGSTMEEFLASHPNVVMPDAVKFGAAEWYDVLSKTIEMDSIITRCWEAMAEFDPSHKIKIAADEWGAFYAPGTELNPTNIHGHAVTLRDAVAAALTLDIFNNHADKMLLALFTGLINQEGGLFRAEGDKFVATPICHVFALYAAHQGGQLLRSEFNAPTIGYAVNGESARLAGLSGSASLQGRDLTLTVVNPQVSEPAEALITLRGGKARSGVAATLTDADIHAQNTFQDPMRVAPSSVQIKTTGSVFHWRFPPASVSRLTLSLAS